MKKTLLFLSLVTLCSASVMAQDIKPFSLYLGAGVSLPNGDFSDPYKMGLHATAGIGLKLAPGFQIVPKAEFHTFSLDKSFLETTEGATSVDGGSLNGILGGADLRFAPPVPMMPIKPFFFGGGGMARLSQSDLTYTVGGLETTKSYDAQTKFYWNLGAGLELGGNPVMSFFVQARYLQVSTDNVKSNMIPITAGIKF